MKCFLVVVFLAAAASFLFRAPANAADAPPPSNRTGEAAELESLRASAQGGDSLAQFNLGMAYAEGRNTAIDRVEALAWLTLAAESGTTGIELGNLLVSLDGEQIKAAGRRLEAIRASSPGLRKSAAADASSGSPRGSNPAPIIAVPSNSTAPSPPQITRVVRPPANRPTTERTTPAPVIIEERGEDTGPADAAKWAAEKAALAAKNDALARELNEARTQLNALRSAAGAKGTIADADGRAREILALEKSLAVTREELAAAKTALAIADAQAKSAKSAQAPAETDTELASLRRQVRLLEQDLQSATAALKRVAADKMAAETALAAANQRLTQVAQGEPPGRQPGTSPSRQTAASADARLAQLQSELNQAKTRMTDAQKTIAARDEELARLRAANAAAATRQSTADHDGEVAGRIADDARQRLANVTRDLAEAHKQLEAARPLESRLRDLEAEKAALLNRPPAEGVSKDEFARVVATRAEFEQKLSTALQSYTLVVRERDGLRAQAAAARELESRVRQLEAEKANLLKSTGDTASNRTEIAQIIAAKADAESKLSTVLRSFTLLTKERDELRARVAELSKKVSAASGDEPSRQK